MDRALDPPEPTDVRRLYHGPKFDLELLTLPGDDGSARQMAVVRHVGACAILPILEPAGDGRPAMLVLIRNQRPAVGRALWEIPAGTLDPGESPHQCALRELAEETGYQAETLRPIGRFYTTPGMTDELMHAFVAQGLRHVGQSLDQGERIEVHHVRADEALAMIDDGRLMDAKSIIPILQAARAGLLGVGP
ncbi:MAG: ADP-ribose pyrophosphatase [Phycisphaerales bacterium]|nr:MAG: ADP-ribose pyrophosphatase [Phycisphaerales bacterium]